MKYIKLFEETINNDLKFIEILLQLTDIKDNAIAVECTNQINLNRVFLTGGRIDTRSYKHNIYIDIENYKDIAIDENIMYISKIWINMGENRQQIPFIFFKNNNQIYYYYLPFFDIQFNKYFVKRYLIIAKLIKNKTLDKLKDKFYKVNIESFHEDVFINFVKFSSNIKFFHNRPGLIQHIIKIYNMHKNHIDKKYMIAFYKNVIETILSDGTLSVEVIFISGSNDINLVFDGILDIVEKDTKLYAKLLNVINKYINLHNTHNIDRQNELKSFKQKLLALTGDNFGLDLI